MVSAERLSKWKAWRPDAAGLRNETQQPGILIAGDKETISEEIKPTGFRC